MSHFKFQKLTTSEIACVERLYKKFYGFIGLIPESVPRYHADSGSTGDESSLAEKKLPPRLCPARLKEKKTVRTVEELEEKLQNLKGKPNLAYKEKLQKKGIKSRLKKKEKKERTKKRRLEAKAQAIEKKAGQSKEIENSIQSKPVFNQEGEMVFSKFDFSELGAKPRRKTIKDPNVALQKITKEQERLQKLVDSGDKEKAVKIKEKKAWKNALLKAEGVKVKDDPDRLKKTIKKIKKMKEKSRAKWQANLKRVEKEKEERQKKRLDNIKARSRDRKLKKLKTQAKRGKIIAGF